MASRRDDHFATAVPEADRFEQEQTADPSTGDEPDWPTPPTQDADEADRLEQALPVLTDPDEDYEPDQG